MHSKAAVGIGFVVWAATAVASITQLAPLPEVSQPGVIDSHPAITRDDRALVFYRLPDPFDFSSETFVEASRATPGDAFTSVSSSAFASVLGSAFDITPCLDNDRLTLWFASNRDGDMDVYEARRTSAKDSFSLPRKLGISAPGASDTQPRIARGGLALYFLSDRDGAGHPALFRAERATPGDEFSSLTLAATWPAAYSFLEISEDERTLLLTQSATPQQLFGARRASAAEPFGAIERIHIFESGVPRGGSLNGQGTRIYLGFAQSIIDPAGYDIAAGDFAYQAIPDPTPTPLPALPAPKPVVRLGVSHADIEMLTGLDVNPRGGAFDSQGRYVFFDQRAPITGGATIGSDAVVRVRPETTPPALEILSTVESLAGADSRWARSVNWPVIAGLDILSDDSIALLGETLDEGSTDFQAILIVQPAATPESATVRRVARFTRASVEAGAQGAAFGALAVDRAAQPNWIYFAVANRIYRVAANQSDAQPLVWHTCLTLARIHDLAIESGGRVLVGGEGADNLYWIDPGTHSETALVPGGLGAALGIGVARVEAFALRSSTRDILGLYRAASPLPGTSSPNVLFFLSAQPGGAYTAINYLAEIQLYTDADIAPLKGPSSVLTLPGGGLDFEPEGHFAWLSLGTPYESGAAPALSNFNGLARVGASPTEGVEQTGFIPY